MNSEAVLRDSRNGVRNDNAARSAGARLWPVVDNENDYFVERNGVKFAGTHLIIDLWGATNLDRLDLVEETLETAAEDAGATKLHTHLHHFTPNGGISGVVVLAESHISIHTWPERNYAALDVFMCGSCDPYRCIPHLQAAFHPEHVTLNEIKRGMTTW
ncbi:MAG: adenosylmethionine decarboxylase [Rhodospirillaceae bacterium]|nr:adenosylmethionine decarboxylase [Rhodospirillaceae bacterium]